MGYHNEAIASSLPMSRSKGDPLQWLWAHAAGIRTVLRLDDYLRKQDKQGLSRYLESYRGPSLMLPDGTKPDVSGDLGPGFLFGCPNGVGFHELRSDRPKRSSEAFIEEVINTNLPLANKVVYRNTHGELEEDYLFPASVVAA